MIRLTASALACVLLVGCASFSEDGGFDTVAQLTQERIGQTPRYQRNEQQSGAAAERTAGLLAQPLNANSAVELALLNNGDLQARYAALGIAEADRVRAGRLANPSFGFGRLSGGGVVEIDRAVLFDVLGLITMPVATQFAQRQLAQAQLQAAYDTVRLAQEARTAFFDAVAAEQLQVYFAQVKDAADAASELAQRMAAVGNFSKLARMREQLFYADATAQLARASHQTLATRERLTRVLALSGDQRNFQLPERLPDLPASPTEARDAEQTAMQKRIDVQLARHDTALTAKSLGLTQATRFINVLQVGYQNSSTSGEKRSNGYEIELALPLFDFGSTRVARAETIYRQAMARTAQVAVNAQSEVRESYSAYRTAYDLALHYRDEVVPLRQRMSEEKLLRYNGMLASVFELLADAREQITSVTASVQALRDYWVAETQLQTALTSGSPGAAAGTASSPAAAAAPAAH